MKYIKTLLTLSLAVFLFTACGNETDQEMPADMADQANEQMSEQAGNMQAQFVSGIQKNLSGMEEGMTEVENGIKETEGDTKASLQEEWKKLKTQKEDLEGMISKVKSNEVDDWGQMKTDIQDQWTSLKSTYQNLRDKLNLS